MLLEANCNAPPLITDGLGQSRRAAGSVLVSGKMQLKEKMLFTHFSENNQQGNYMLGNAELNAACCSTALQNQRRAQAVNTNTYKYLSICRDTYAPMSLSIKQRCISADAVYVGCNFFSPEARGWKI